MKRHISPAAIIVLFVAASTQIAMGQDRPRIAIIPLNPIGVSKAEAQTMTGLLETGLVKADVYEIIEQSSMKDVLGAQEYSLSDCTDEACAIQFGKLLSAEQIVLGQISKIGGLYIVNVKMIDVQTGRNLRADKIDASSAEELTKLMDLLAYKLAGLTLQEGTQQVIAREFGELFVATVPDGAQIYVNGVKKGQSPNLISKVPVGTVEVEVRKGSLYGRQEVHVSEDTTAEVAIELKATFGNLFVASSEKDVEVFLDSVSLGMLGTGFYKEISVGTYTVELKGEDTYWSGEVEVVEGRSARVDAYPRPFGVLQYFLPDGATAEITGTQYRQAIRGSGTLEIWAGQYLVSVSSTIHDGHEQKIKIARGDVAEFKPELKFTAEYVAGHTQEKRDVYLTNLKERETRLMNSSVITENDLAVFKAFLDEIRQSQWDVRDVLHQGELVLQRLEKRREAAERERRIAQLISERAAIESGVLGTGKTLRTLGWFSVGIGATSAALVGLCHYLAENAYDQYQAALTTLDARQHRMETEQWSDIRTVGVVVTIGAAVLAPVLLLLGGDGAVSEDALQIEDELRRLQEEGD